MKEELPIGDCGLSILGKRRKIFQKVPSAQPLLPSNAELSYRHFGPF
jgi:hypothetical protein